MIKFEDLHQAEVINNNDPFEQGRIQIYVPSFMQGWKLNILPWARPWNNAPGGDFGNSIAALNCRRPGPPDTNTPTKRFNFGELDVPEEKSVVWVFFAEEEAKKNPFYLTGVQLSASSPGKSFRQTTGDFLKADIKSDYPDIKYRIDKNGYTKFHSTSIEFRESGEYNSANSYFYHKEDQFTANAYIQISRLVAGDNKFEMQGDEATKVYSIEATTDTNSRLKLTSDKLQNSNILEAFADNQVKFRLESSTGAKSADLNVGSSKITIDDITGKIELLTAQLLKITVPLTTISGQVNVATTVQTPGIIAPPSPGNPVTIQGTSSPGPATDPAVKGNEYTITMTQIIAAINSLASATSQLSTAIITMSGGFLFPTGANVTAAAQATAALTDISSASSSASSATTSLPSSLSSNVLIN